MTPVSRIVVTGASGKVGGMIAAMLARDGIPQQRQYRSRIRAEHCPRRVGGEPAQSEQKREPFILRPASAAPDDRHRVVSGERGSLWIGEPEIRGPLPDPFHR